MISADTFCCTVQVTSHLKDVKHFFSKCVSWHSQKEASMEGKHRTKRAINQSGSKGGSHVTFDAVSAHLEMRQELTESKQTVLTAVNYEKNFLLI